MPNTLAHQQVKSFRSCDNRPGVVEKESEATVNNTRQEENIEQRHPTRRRQRRVDCGDSIVCPRWGDKKDGRTMDYDRKIDNEIHVQARGGLGGKVVSELTLLKRKRER